MPSLLNTTVAANYGLMSTQDTYGTGQAFINFGTRNLRLLKVVLSGGSLNDLRYQDGTTSSTTYAQANSIFGQCVRALQTSGEVYYVGQPDATTFMVLVSGDTVDAAAVATPNTDGLTYGKMAAVIKAFLDGRTAAAHGAGAAGTATTVTITATGTAAYPNMFVGGGLNTFA
jgi:hypothetical protein